MILFSAICLLPKLPFFIYIKLCNPVKPSLNVWLKMYSKRKDDYDFHMREKYNFYNKDDNHKTDACYYPSGDLYTFLSLWNHYQFLEVRESEDCEILCYQANKILVRFNLDNSIQL